MNKTEIWSAVNTELKKAKKKFPNWPDHHAAQAGIICEESGELMRECLQWKYELEETFEGQAQQQKRMNEEAIQVIVTAIRFLENN